MAKKPDIPAITSGFLSDILSTYGDAVRSVILYGPAARGEELGNREGLTFLVILNDNSPSELSKCVSYIGKWERKRIALPLFLEDGYIQQSLDTFPLEFIAMKRAYRVLSGADVLANISFKPSDVRAQCERELKGKLIHLRAEYLASRHRAKHLTDLAERSLAAFRLVFTGALSLKKIDIPSETSRVLDAVCESYGLDRVVFKNLETIALGSFRVEDENANILFDRYVEEIAKLSRAIDVLVS
jgi:hypothetical protein